LAFSEQRNDSDIGEFAAVLHPSKKITDFLLNEFPTPTELELLGFKQQQSRLACSVAV
jgi:hypothetical protein